MPYSRPDPARAARGARRQYGPPADQPGWHVHVDDSGGFTAVLTGFGPPITVSADDYDQLSKRVKELMFRAML
jgi:hypothetical protein